MFLKEVSYAHQGCIYLLKYVKYRVKAVKYYYNLKQVFCITDPKQNVS